MFFEYATFKLINYNIVSFGEYLFSLVSIFVF